MTPLGKRLRELRGEFSLYEVGKAAEVDRKDIKNYEEGKYLPKLGNLRKLGEYYEAYPDLFFLYLEALFPDEQERELIHQWANRQ